MPQLTKILACAAISLVVAQALPVSPAYAQNSRQATEAVRKHRAESGTDQQAPRTSAASTRTEPKSKPDTTRPYRSSADPSANPRVSLRRCMDHADLNISARDQCFRQHCQGHWGEGQCPPGSDTWLGSNRESHSNTALGKCLADAGNNPFRRSSCGWAHCKPHWDTPECKSLVPQHPRQND